MLSALQLDGDNNDESNETTEVVEVVMGQKYKVKINKVSHNKLSCTEIYASGIKKTTSLNLTVVRLRNQ